MEPMFLSTHAMKYLMLGASVCQPRTVKAAQGVKRKMVVERKLAPGSSRVEGKPG